MCLSSDTTLNLETLVRKATCCVCECVYYRNEWDYSKQKNFKIYLFVNISEDNIRNYLASHLTKYRFNLRQKRLSDLPKVTIRGTAGARNQVS